MDSLKFLYKKLSFDVKFLLVLPIKDRKGIFNSIKLLTIPTQTVDVSTILCFHLFGAGTV